jgi:malate dehydrogenase (oxaloacetate-decarboxylating)
MAIAAAHAVADFAEKKIGINPDYIMPTMQETEVFAVEAADVAMQAIKDGVARIELTWDEVYKTTLADINEARSIIDLLQKNEFIKAPDLQMLAEARDKAVAAVS